MNDTLISIVVPVYNVSQYLERCIQSVIYQTYENLDIILIDDGSTDNSGLICDKYAKIDKRIRVLHQQNSGLSAARNAGIEIAKGKYITFIDSDDYVDSDYVSFLYDLIKRTGCSLAICSHTVFYENGTIIKKADGTFDIFTSEEVLEKILYDKGIDLSAWAKLYDINLFKYTRFPVGRYYEDAATTYKLVHDAQKIVNGSESKYNYMIRQNSISNNTFTEKKLDLIISTKEMENFVCENYPNLRKAAKRRTMYAYLSTLSQLANSCNDNKEIERMLIKYIRNNGYKLLFNKKVSKRDKFGILSALFGFKFYRYIWNIYKDITGRN